METQRKAVARLEAAQGELWRKMREAEKHMDRIKALEKDKHR